MHPPRIPIRASPMLPRLSSTQASLPLRPTHRTFTTTPTANANLRTKTFKPKHTLQSYPSPTPPAYPYGAPQWYKQSAQGLYGGKKIQFGNNVSEKNEIKTRRSWHPNIKYKWLYSEALGKKIRVKLSTRVLRTIDKVGGLDEYVVGRGAERMRELGPYGWGLRWLLLQEMEKKGMLEGREGLKRELERDREIRDRGEAAVAALEVGEEVAEEGVEAQEEDEEWEDEELEQAHMEEMPPPPDERPGLVTRIRDGLSRPFRRS